MNKEQYLKNLTQPTHKIDVVLDTDAYNEIDDQFAIAYMISNMHRFNIKGFCAAPFFNRLSTSASDGMIKSYNELFNLLNLANRPEFLDKIYKGSDGYLKDECTPVVSDASKFMSELSNEYSPENPLYIIAIGAITNVASALLMNPDMKENTVIVWLGGHGIHMPDTKEFNMRQDVAAARVVFGCGVPLVQLPCLGVIDHFAVSKYEFIHLLKGKNSLCEYLADHTIKTAEEETTNPIWSRILWDVTAIAWLLNDDSKFMSDTLISSPIPEYDGHYSQIEDRHLIKYVYQINRDALLEDLVKKLTT